MLQDPDLERKGEDRERVRERLCVCLCFNLDTAPTQGAVPQL